jgi:hypothetical protein
MLIIIAWQHILSKVILKGCKNCCISNAMDGTKDDMLWLWRWRQWHWLVKVDRIWHVLCIQCMKSIVKYFFLNRCFIFGALSYIWINTFSLGRGVLLGEGILDLGRYGNSPGIRFAQLGLSVEKWALAVVHLQEIHHFILRSCVTPCMIRSNSVWTCFNKTNLEQQGINTKRDEMQRVKCSIPNTCLVSLHGHIIFVLCFLPSESLLDEDVESGFWNKKYRSY